MDVKKNHSLKSYNTFGIDAHAENFVSVSSIDELREVLKLPGYSNKFILGGGSNMLLTKDVEGLVIHINLKGISIVDETETNVILKANAGENWHQFVLYCIQNDFGGIENMSLIPGNVGTAPIQNIGAYGVELKDTFVSCEAMNMMTGELKIFEKEQCKFDYRDSVFKSELKGQYIITSVNFALTKNNHKLHLDYGAIKNELEQKEIKNPSITDISNAVIAIRQSKLPDPKEIGNSGSFFKNPVISKSQYDNLKQNFPTIPQYPVSDFIVKVPAGWLIETAGFKGKTFKNYGVHKKQALVLVNYGGAKGQEILELAQLIQSTIKRIFNIDLETEVNII